MLVAVLSVAVLAGLPACSRHDPAPAPYAATTAGIGESQAVLGWNMSVSNLRWDSDHVLVDIDAAPTDPAKPHASPEDLRFGLYGTLAHPIEATGLGSCTGVTTLAIHPLVRVNAKLVRVNASLCAQGEINQAVLYATLSVVGTHTAVWTSDA